MSELRKKKRKEGRKKKVRKKKQARENLLFVALSLTFKQTK